MPAQFRTKYEPQTLDHVVGQEQNISRLKAFVAQETVQDCLFSGPSGTGKTASARALARELYASNWEANFLDLNASDDRGIDVIRTDVKQFARSKPIGAEFKIVFLDEADSLTTQAQGALRRTIENNADVARFILAANYPSQIIDAIHSRCSLFRFAPLPDDAIQSHLSRIVDLEGIDATPEAIREIAVLADGDMRTALNLLETVTITESDSQITQQSVHRFATTPTPELVQDVIELGIRGETADAREILRAARVEDGIVPEEITRVMYTEFLEADLSPDAKSTLFETLAHVDYRIRHGAYPPLQLEHLVITLSDLESDAGSREIF